MASFGPEHTTEVEIRFEPVGAETRVTVAHSGWESVPQEHVARHGFALSLTNQRQGEQWRRGSGSTEGARLNVSATYP